MDERFESVLGAAFPDRDIAETTPSSRDDRNETLGVEFADGQRAYCKLAIDDGADRLATERAVLTYLDCNEHVRVPAVLASGDTPAPYIVTDHLPGEPLFAVKESPDGPSAETAMHVLGEALAELHAEQFDAHGEIVDGGPDHLDVDSASWTTVFVEQVRGIRDFAQSDRFERYVEDVVEVIEANEEILDAAPATLVHIDPNPANCYYHDAGIGFLDWEYAHVGDPARDLHRVLEQHYGLFRPNDPEHEVEALYEGYRAVAGQLPEGYENRLPIYEAVRLLGASAFFESKADAAEESRDAVADWMDAEMERRLDAIR